MPSALRAAFLVEQSLDRYTPEINEGSPVPFPKHVLPGLRLFSLGRMIVITDNEFSKKLRFSGKDSMPKTDSRTAPDDDPA
jgi:hypothetical protein